MAARPDDDLFSDSQMSFGDHLEELRQALIKAVYGLLVGMAIGLYFANNVVDMITQPLRASLEEYNIQKAKLDLIEEGAELSPEVIATIEQERMTPTDQYVDPSVLFEELRIQQVGEEAAAEMDPYRFGPAAFEPTRVDSLCSLLVKQGGQGKTTPSFGQLAWPLLSGEEKQLLERLAEVHEPSESDLTELAAVFNRLTIEKSFVDKLYDTEDEDLAIALDEVESEKALTRLAAATASGGEGANPQRLVRLLAHACYPDDVKPFVLNMVPLQVWQPMDVKVQAFGSAEVFMIWLKAGIVTGFIIASPWIFWQLWSFVASGLYPHEKSYVYIYLPFSLILFVAGVLLAYFFVFRFVLDFLFQFNLNANIPIDPRISEWISFVLILPLGFGLSFQLPLVMLFLERIGLFETRDYLAKWRIAVVVIFVISMLLTPADPMSMLLMAAPLTALYFLGVGLCKWMPQRRNPYGELSEA